MSEFKAFAESTDIKKITAFLENGLYISDTMLVMELDLTGLDEPKLNILIKAKETELNPQADSSLNYDISLYDTWEMDEYLSLNGQAFEEECSLEEMEELLNNAGSAIYVLKREGRIISSVMLWDFDEETVATEKIFTIPDEQGKGYGQFLLAKILIKLKQSGKKKARLTVYGSNTPAITMYLKLGFNIKKVLQEFSYE